MWPILLLATFSVTGAAASRSISTFSSEREKKNTGPPMNTDKR
jgi:hypothetical protein